MRRLYWPKFWSNQEWTRTHLVQGSTALCGEVPNWETYREDESGNERHLCKKCRQVATKRGYGK